MPSPSLERLTLPSNQLGSEELAEVVASMREGATRPIQPGLAKTASEESELEDVAKELMTGEIAAQLERSDPP